MNVQVQPKEQALEEPASMIEQVAQLAQKDLALWSTTSISRVTTRKTSCGRSAPREPIPRTRP